MENLVETNSPFPMVLRNPYRNLKSEKSEDYVQKPQRNCRFMNSAPDESVWNLFSIRHLGSKKGTQSPETDFIRMVLFSIVFWCFKSTSRIQATLPLNYL
jgi:hypothetical protein